MKSIRKSMWVWLSLALIASLLGACAQPATPQVQIVEKTVQVIETVIVQSTAQVVEKLVTPTPETPQVGGTMVLTQYSEPTTLDQQLANGDLGMNMTRWLGSTLLTYDQSGKLIGYLADSWESTPDGLIWTFHLKKNVKFHNGEPLTADDFVYTIERTKAPDFSGLAQSNWEPVDKAEAVDPYTLKITLKNPFYPFLDNVTQFSAQPLNKKAVESAGADYGRHPIGVGPYKFKEWVQSQKVTLERNEDFNWGPAFAHAGPAYIQTLQFNILPEPATIVAGLEAGEIDFSEIQAADINTFKNSDKYVVWQGPQTGIYPYVAINTHEAPFDDVRVRQAFNWAVDREALIKVAAQGNAVVQYGPISASVPGYWPGVEYIGYGYDLEKAKALMKDAGYTLNSAGMLEKNGQAFKVVMKMDSTDATGDKTAEVLKEQYKALGVDIELQQEEMGTFYADLTAGKFTLGVPGLGYANDDLLYLMFHTGGAVNLGNYSDPVLDAMLEKMRTTIDPTAHNKVSADVQKYAVEHALVVPTFTAIETLVINPRIKGIVFIKGTDPRYAPQFFDAYISK